MSLSELPTELWWAIIALAADLWTDEFDHPSHLTPEAFTKRWMLIGGSCTRSEQKNQDILTARRTRRSLALVCRTWYKLATPYLYRHLTLLPNQTFSLSDATMYTYHLDIFDWTYYLATKPEAEAEADADILPLFQEILIAKEIKPATYSPLYPFLLQNCGNLIELEIDDIVLLSHAVSSLKNLRILKVGVRGTAGLSGRLDCIGQIQSLVRLQLVWRGLYHRLLASSYPVDPLQALESSATSDSSIASQLPLQSSVIIQQQSLPSHESPQTPAQIPTQTLSSVTLPNLYELIITRTTHQNAARASPCVHEVTTWTLPSLRICSVDHFADWAALRVFNAQITHMEALQMYGGSWELLPDIPNDWDALTHLRSRYPYDLFGQQQYPSLKDIILEWRYDPEGAEEREIQAEPSPHFDYLSFQDPVTALLTSDFSNLRKVSVAITEDQMRQEIGDQATLYAKALFDGYSDMFMVRHKATFGLLEGDVKY